MGQWPGKKREKMDKACQLCEGSIRQISESQKGAHYWPGDTLILDIPGF